MDSLRREQGIDLAEPRKLRFQPPPPSTPEEDAAIEAERARLREAEETSRRRSAWVSLCTGECESYRNAKLSNYVCETDEQRRVLAAVQKYVDTLAERVASGEGFLFFGPCGTGKDHFAMSILRIAVLKHGLHAKRINGPEWYGKLRDLMDQESISEASEVSALGSADILLISDPLPPLDRLSKYEASMLYRVLEKRVANHRPTLITMNTTGESDARDRMGHPTVDRMKQSAWVAACNWPSHRKPAHIV